MIRSKANASPGQSDMVAQMTGRMNDLQFPATSGNLLAVCQFNVRAEITVDSLTTACETLPRQIGHDRAAPGRRAAECKDRGTRACGQRGGQRGMIQMGVSDKDMADALIRLQRL